MLVLQPEEKICIFFNQMDKKAHVRHWITGDMFDSDSDNMFNSDSVNIKFRSAFANMFTSVWANIFTGASPKMFTIGEYIGLLPGMRHLIQALTKANDSNKKLKLNFLKKLYKNLITQICGHNWLAFWKSHDSKPPQNINGISALIKIKRVIHLILKIFFWTTANMKWFKDWLLTFVES